MGYQKQEIDILTIKAKAQGHERQILKRLGFSDIELKLNHHQSCPSCGGKDKYWAMSESRFWCNDYQSKSGLNVGDWIDQAIHCKKLSLKEVLDTAKDHLGLKEMSRKDRTKLDAEMKEMQRKALISARIKQSNTIEDSPVEFALQDLEMIISQRDKDKFPSIDEEIAAQKLIRALNERYNHGKLETNRKWVKENI